MNAYHKTNLSFKKWIDSFRQNPQESCIYSFDELAFENHHDAQQLFLPITKPDKIYLIKHRKVLDMIQFLRTRFEIDSAFPLSVDQPEYVLASSVRIFDLNETDHTIS